MHTKKNLKLCIVCEKKAFKTFVSDKKAVLVKKAL